MRTYADFTELRVQRLKRGLETVQYVRQDIRAEVMQLSASRMPNARLFPWTRISFWKALQTAAFRSGVDPIYAHFHAFRPLQAEDGQAHRARHSQKCKGCWATNPPPQL